MKRGVCDRGFALLIVLWSAVLLTLLVTGVTQAGRAEVRLASNLRGAAAAEAAADGAIYAAAFHLLDPVDRWAADNRSYTVDFGGARVAIRIENEGGKINPNVAQPGLMQALLQQAGAGAQASVPLAAAIAEWRFPGQASNLGGTKAEHYRAAGLPYAPANAPFESVPELGLVLGMTPALLARLAPYLTVLTDEPPDPAAAPPELRRLLGEPAGVRGEADPIPPRTVTITADALTGGGSRFRRRAAIRLGGTPTEPLMLVLTWTDAASAES